MPVETCQKYTATLSEILALTPVVQTIADATDVPGVRLEWMNGAWYGDCGFPSAAQHSALLAANAYNSLALGAKATIPSGPVTWRGAVAGGWVADATFVPVMLGLRPNMREAATRPGSPARHLIAGDSNVTGQGAGTGAQALIGAREKCFAVKLAKSLGWQTGSFFGEGNSGLVSVTPSQYDPRLSMGSWTAFGTTNTFGGRFMYSNAASTTDFAFAPESIFDKFTFWYPIGTGFSTAIVVKVDGVAIDTIDQSTLADSFAGKTYSVPLGSHVISVQNASSASAYFAGIETWNSANPAPVLLHGGWCNAKLADIGMTTYAYNPIRAIASIAPDSAHIHCTINDLTVGTAIATIAAKVADIANRINAAGADVIYTVSFPAQHAGAYDGTLNTYAAMMKQTAMAYDGAFADARDTLGGIYEVASSKGLTWNSDHLNEAGYTLEAAQFAKLYQL